MAIQLECFSLIIPIKNIERVYPGGFAAFIAEHGESPSVQYDEHLFHDGAMNLFDIKLMVADWERKGLKLLKTRTGKKVFADMAIVDGDGEMNYPCDWLEVDQAEFTVTFKENFMKARYERFLTSEEYLGKARGLIEFIQNLDGTNGYAFDIHLREKNEVMIYHGNTCVLVIDATGQKLFKLHPEYGRKDKSKDAYAELILLKNHPDDYEKIGKCLTAIIDTVTTKYQKEGEWMNILGVRFGRDCHKDDEFVIIDRESIIGFESQCKKKTFYSDHKISRNKIVKMLQEQEPKKWGIWSEQKKNFGDELDFLALDKNGNLVCIELKYGSNTSGIYWGPLQASMYRDVFKDTLGNISEGIKKMVIQKMEMGILPPWVRHRLPHGAFTTVRGILAVAEPNYNSVGFNKAGIVNTCQAKMNIDPVEIISFDQQTQMKYE